MTLSGEREIASNGLPNRATGVFPNSRNPNRISSQDFNFSFPLFPSKNSSPTYYNVPQAFGITREGVVLDPFANEYYQNNRQSGWQLAALANDLGFDDASAHVQPDGPTFGEVVLETPGASLTPAGTAISTLPTSRAGPLPTRPP